MLRAQATLLAQHTQPARWELRLETDDQFIRSQVCRTPTEVMDTWAAWEAEATEKGWTRHRRLDASQEETIEKSWTRV
jgi:hypothetical protein